MIPGCIQTDRKEDAIEQFKALLKKRIDPRDPDHIRDIKLAIDQVDDEIKQAF